MKERPILFSAPMVRALLDGSKTQTRRVSGLEVINAEPDRYEFRGITSGPGVPHFAFHDRKSGAQVLVKCKQGQPGDRLWVREAWRAHLLWEKLKPSELCGMEVIRYEADQAYRIDAGPLRDMGKLRPSMFMPRAASRITLEIVNVRVERLQGISETDAVAEGCKVTYEEEIPEFSFIKLAKAHYGDLWESINGPGSWTANPWVWVIEFKRVTS